MKLTPKDIYTKKSNGEKITALSLYDYPTACVADEAGVDILVIGDSVGMALLGHENTQQVTVENILYHTQAVSRAAKRSLVIADMPIHSCEDSESALKHAKQFLEKGHADAVKIEGGISVQPQIQQLIAAGIPVMGHIGMLPQTSGSHFHVQGKIPEEARAILADAKMLDRLGVFAVVLECIPAKLAAEITQAVRCPTIGIGAGPETDGQILVLQDILGIRSSVSPRFVRRYADMEGIIKKAVGDYCSDVRQKKYPSEKESFQ